MTRLVLAGLEVGVAGIASDQSPRLLLRTTYFPLCRKLSELSSTLGLGLL